jgi:RNA polymerase sigma factor (sigma-70 family)
MKVPGGEGDRSGKSPDAWYEEAFAIGVEIGERLVPYDVAKDLSSKMARSLHRQLLQGKAPPLDLRSWVATIMLRGAARHRKEERARARKFEQYEIKRTLVKREWMHPEAAFDLDERQEEVKRAFDELSEMQLKVLILTRLQGLKYKEVAHELGISLNTVRTHKDRAIKKLKELLGVRSKEKK